MSRFEWDDYGEPPDYPNASDLFETRARAAIYSKRGRASLRELREALMALPKHELIEGALCRRRQIEDDEQLSDDFFIHEGQLTLEGGEVNRTFLASSPASSSTHEIIEGVCAVGAFMWWKKVKAGEDPVKAFLDLPTLDTGPDGEDGDGDEMFQTAWAGERAGLTHTLAWELASGNDETFASATPAERWQKFIDWIDGVLASPPLTRSEGVYAEGRKRLGYSWTV